MADTLVRDMTADASPTGDDLIYVVNDPAGTPGNRKVTLTNLLGFVEANISGLATSVITSGTFADARIAQTNVTQHQAALTITESQISDLGTYLTDIVSDTTPQLGGSLDVNGNSIVSTSNGNITLAPNGTGNVVLGNYVLDADATVGAGQDNYVMTYNHSAGTWGPEASAGGGLTLPYSDGDSVTGSASTTTFELTPTWNTTGTPKGFAVNVSYTATGDHAPAIYSSEVGKTDSQFEVAFYASGRNVDPFGRGPTMTGAQSAGGVYFGAYQGYFVAESNYLGIRSNNKWQGAITAFNGAIFPKFGWNNNGAFSTVITQYTADTYIERDAAYTLNQRNGSNAQTFRITNTWTDASNNEFMKIGWNSNVLELGPVANGTGTLRGMKVGVTSSALLGFFGATPVSQQNTTGTTTGFFGGFGTSVNDDSTFTGNVGSTAYTVGDIVRALKNLGLMAS